MLLGAISLLIGQIFGNSVVPIGTKIASPFTGPLIFVFLRFVVGLVLFLFILPFAQKRKITGSKYKDFALLGFLLMGNVLLFTFGISYTTVIMSTLIYSLTPLFVGVGGHFFLQESFDKQQLVGLVVSFAGLLFLLSQSLSGLQQNAFGQPLGNILICIAMVSYSFYIIYSRKVLHKNAHAPIQTTFLTFAFTTLFLLAVGLIGMLFGKITIEPLPEQGIWGIFIVGGGSIAQYLFLQIGVKQTNAFTASLFQYTGPFIAAAIAIPLLHEQITAQLLMGGLLILIGVFVGTTYNQFKKKFLVLFNA